jgi:hypothetical protein
MSKIIVHKFRIAGMHDSGAVSVVRHGLSAIPGVATVTVNLRKMQVEVTASRVILATQIRAALSETNCTMSDLSVSATMASQGLRNDEPEET